MRSVSAQENNLNLGRRRVRNVEMQSGVNGVYWYKASRKWMARLKIKGKWIYLGCHENLDDAIAIRRRAEVFYGFHENHGKRPATEDKPDAERKKKSYAKKRLQEALGPSSEKIRHV